MNSKDFSSWFRYHSAAFPNLVVWFSGLDDPAETRAHWQRILGPLSLDEAKTATDEMLDDENLQPRSWSNHPSRIRKLSVEQRWQKTTIRDDERRCVGGQVAYYCRICRDTGYVSIWHWQTILDVLEGRPHEWPKGANGRNLRAHQCDPEDHPVRRNSMAVFCTCRIGDSRFNSSRAKRKMPRYSEDKHILYDTATDLDPVVERAEEVARNYNGTAKEMANYTHEFDEFNDS